MTEKIRFADKIAEEVYTTLQRYREVKDRFSTREVNFEPIYFEERRRDALTVIFAGSGAFVKGSYYVPERTRLILRELEIPYKQGFQE